MPDQETPARTPFEILQAAIVKVETAQNRVNRFQAEIDVMTGAGAPSVDADDLYGSMFQHLLGFSLRGATTRRAATTVTINSTYSSVHVDLSPEDEAIVREIAQKTLHTKLQNAKTDLEIAQQDLADAAMVFAAGGEGVPEYGQTQVGAEYDRRRAA